MSRGYSRFFAAKCEVINLETGNEVHDENTVNEDAIPAEDVKTTVEETGAASPADDNSADELIVDESEGDHKKPSMTQEEAYAAMKREKRKRKGKNAENEELKRELAELKAQVGSIAKGEPPTLEGCNFVEADFQEATRKYYSQPAKEDAPPQKSEVSPDLAKIQDQAEFYLYQKEQDLAGKIPSYSEDKEAVSELLKEKGYHDTDGAMIYLSHIARQKGVDIAKVIVAISKVPKIIDEIASAGSSEIAVADVLERAANRVKPRSKQKIDAQPEPNINSAGPVDGGAAAVEKLRKQWVENPTTANHSKYNEAKRKLKAKANG